MVKSRCRLLIIMYNIFHVQYILKNYFIRLFLFTQGYITFHSYGQYILYPWGYAKKYTADHDALDRVGRLMASAIKQESGNTYTVGNSASLLYAASGQFSHYSDSTKHIFSISKIVIYTSRFLLPRTKIDRLDEAQCLDC